MSTYIKVTLISLLLLTANNSYAIWGTLAGTLGAGIAIKQAGDELDETVARAERAGKELIRISNRAAKDRLDQVDLILDDALAEIGRMQTHVEAAVVKIIEQATKDIQEIEKKIMGDLSLLLWKAECGLKRATLEDAREMLGGLGKVLGTHQITIVAPVQIDNANENGLKQLLFWCENFNEKTFELKTPFGRTFVEIETYMLKQIDQNVTLDTPTHVIVDTYEYLSTLARKTTCFYNDTSSTYNRKHIGYLEKAERYKNSLKIEVAF